MSAFGLDAPPNQQSRSSPPSNAASQEPEVVSPLEAALVLLMNAEPGSPQHHKLTDVCGRLLLANANPEPF